MGAHIKMSRFASSDGQMSVTHTSLSITASADMRPANPGDCFDPQTCCDEQERRLIEELRSYLRPQCAPACLIERLQRMFDAIDAVDDAIQSGELPAGGAPAANHGASV
ncbi:hypothetical protein [Bifidobacterium xylocopae]|uniref:hypothetical protein n=1 Tax=Bifidobacterium xylocopae TaxID=2493119 RepID=UPI001F2AD04F|nr:hypothetical protein [Bifidobacterium xylocopae]